jgi:hypothetical protein
VNCFADRTDRRRAGDHSTSSVLMIPLPLRVAVWFVVWFCGVEKWGVFSYELGRVFCCAKMERTAWKYSTALLDYCTVLWFTRIQYRTSAAGSLEWEVRYCIVLAGEKEARDMLVRYCTVGSLVWSGSSGTGHGGWDGTAFSSPFF